MRSALLTSALALLALAPACRHPKPLPPPQGTGRCDVDVLNSGLFSVVGTTARARTVQGPGDLIGGQYAQAREGDVLLSNDRIRAVIQQPGRTINPVLYGGILIDADVQRPAGEPGHDQFGRMGLIYQFGRTVNATKVEILDDGTGGGPAIVAATGSDALNNYAHIALLIDTYAGGVGQLSVDPEAPLPLLITTYYVLSPGENRVRILSALCNQGTAPVVTEVGDLIDQGGTMDYFNPAACTHTLGNRNCLADPAPWYAFQGDDVAYGLREYRLDDPTTPDIAAIISVVGITGTVAGGHNQAGILTWLDSQAQIRPGSFGIRPGDKHLFLRDFVVGHSLGDVSSTFLALDNTAHGRLQLTVNAADGTPAPGAHVAVTDPASGNEVTMVVADASGKAQVDLPLGGYSLAAALPGRAVGPSQTLQISSAMPQPLTLQVGAFFNLTVAVKDVAGAAMPAKVTVLCPTGICPQPGDSYLPFWDTEQLPTNVQTIALVPPQGTLTFPLPPGQYEVVVTRGPEYNTYPDTWPAQGAAVDLSASDQRVDAVLGKVVDSTGWISADLHVHAVDSSDSSVPNEQRVLSFTASGVDVLCSTDHDFVTDYAPTIRALQADPFLASMIGDELSTFDFGHFNLYPLTVDASAAQNGAFDWGGEDGAHAMRLPDIFGGVRQRSPGAVIQINHGRGKMGALTQLQVDTATGASHVDPATFRLVPAPDATAKDTKLFSGNFDAIEVQNGLVASNALLNDWMTFLSRGWVKTATAVSDTHYTLMYGAGDSRTWVQLEMASPSQFDPAAFAQVLRAHRAFGSNAPFVRLAATRVGGKPQPYPAGIGDTISIDSAAGEQLDLNVDVQSPEWANFDSIEVYTYAPGREAVNGVSNDAWLAPVAQRAVPLHPPLEAVPGPGNLRRIHVNTDFLLSPTQDTWYVVIVRGSSAANSLFPMVLHGVSCGSSGTCAPQTAQAFAFTNPIFVDGDGDGLYDHFPMPASAPVPPPAPGRKPRAASTADAFERLIRDARDHHCGG